MCIRAVVSGLYLRNRVSTNNITLRRRRRLTHGARFLLGNIEEGCIKDGEISVDEVASNLVEGALLLRIRVIVGLGVISVLWDGARAVSGSGQHCPKLVDSPHITGCAACHANNGKRRWCGHCVEGQFRL